MIRIENEKCRLTRNSEVAISEVVLLEAETNYTVFMMSDGKKITSSSTMKRFENVLPKNTFLRINRNIILNKDYIKNIQHNQIEMTTNQVVAISRRRMIYVKTNLL
jgi:two-component system, LytTR family, response regulator